MSKFYAGALLLGALAATALSGPASANIIYDLTLTPNGGGASVTGVLTLDFASVAAVESKSNIGKSDFVSFTLSGSLFGKTFPELFPGDLNSFSIGSTSSTGAIQNSLTLTNDSESPQLDIQGNSFNVEGGPNFANFLGGGSITFGAPMLAAATPLPATLPLFAGGLGFVGYLTKRRNRGAKQVLAAA